MKILAHRGLARGVQGGHGPSSQVRENTLEAFAAAAALSVDGIETDVRRTADGVLVLYHDRILPDGRPLASLTARALAKALAPLSPPRVEEALEAFPDLLWNLEVKDTGALPTLLELLRRAPPRGEVVLTSFDHAGLLEATTKGRPRRGALIAHRPEQPFAESLLEASRPPGAFDVVVWAFETHDRSHMECLAACGVKQWIYGPETVEEHLSLAELPLEAVITDHPERAFPLRGATR